MSILVVAPAIMPIDPDRYGGIERLSLLFARGLNEAGHRVGVIAPFGSRLPVGVAHHPSGIPLEDFREPSLLPALLTYYRGYDVVLDFSHSHPKRLTELAAISPIWHDPGIMQPVLPPHNVAALSGWQAARLRIYQGQTSRVLDPIVYNETYYSRVEGLQVSERCCFIGIMSPEKGALEAARACKALGVGLDIIGAQTPFNPPAYMEAVRALCDGEQIVYHGEVGEEAKREVLRSSIALLYPVSYPPGTGESHSHKMVEAFGVGTCCIAYDQGAMREVIDEGVTGLLINGPEEIPGALARVVNIDRGRCAERAVERWSIPATMERWLPVMEQVAGGLRW